MACALVLFAAACTPDVAPVDAAGPKQERSRRPKPAVSEPSASPAQVDRPATLLVYVKKTALRGYDLATGADEKLRTVPGPDLTLSPDGTRIALVIDKQPGADPEGFADPYVSVAPVTEGAERELGPGRSPRWSPDGRRIAATTDEGVVVYDVEGGGSATVLAGQSWTVLGWSDGRVVAIGEGTTVLAAPNSSEDLGISPAVLWGVSPADDTTLRFDGRKALLMQGDVGVEVEIYGIVGDGAWSPDGKHIAVVAGRGPSTAHLIDTGTGKAAGLADGRGAQGNVVWSGDSKRFAFVRVDPADNLQLQAVVCDVNGSCEPTFSWAQGVLLVGFARS